MQPSGSGSRSFSRKAQLTVPVILWLRGGYSSCQWIQPCQGSNRSYSQDEVISSIFLRCQVGYKNKRWKLPLGSGLRCTVIYHLPYYDSSLSE